MPLEVYASIRFDLAGVSIVVSFVAGKILLVCTGGAQSLSGSSLVIEILLWIIPLSAVDAPENECEACKKYCASDSSDNTADDLFGRRGETR